MSPHTRRRLEIVAAFLLSSALLCDASGALSAEPRWSRTDVTLLSLSLAANLTEDESEWDANAGVGPGRVAGLAVGRLAGNRPNEARLAMQILDAECKALRSALESTLPPDVAAEAVAAMEDDCRARMAELESRAQRLDRGRHRRGLFRRIRIGRAFAWLGRQIVTSLPDVAMAMATGGGGLAARRVIIHNVRRALRGEARAGISRLLARHGVSDRMLALLGLPPAPRRTRASLEPSPTTTDVLDPESVEATRTALAAEMEELYSTDETVIEVRITEADLKSPSSAALFSHAIPGQSDNPNWCTTMSIGGPATDFAMRIVFNFETGKVTGDLGGTFACMSDADCDEPGEYMRGRFDGQILNGWVRPDGLGGWDMGADLDGEASLSAELSCGKIIQEGVGVVNDFRIRGSSTMKVTGYLEGDSWGAPGAEGPNFTIYVPAVQMPEEAPYLGFFLSCFRPTCPMPEQFPLPPE